MSDIARLLSALSKASKGDGPKVNEDEITDEQLVSVLREAASKRSQVMRFVPGQIIIHKYPEVSGTTDAHRPVMFSRYLDKPLEGYKLPGTSAEDITNYRMAVIQDCAIMCLLGGRIVEFLADSREYMLHPDFLIKH